MKVSLALTALILILGAVFAVKDHQELKTLRADHQTLAAEARELGISTDFSDDPTSTRRTRPQREDRDDRSRQIAAEMIAFAKDMQEMQKEGREPDPEMQKRIMTMMENLMELSPSQLKTFIAELRDAPGLEDEMRQGMIGFAIMSMAERSPQAALAVFVESNETLGPLEMSNHVVSSALTRWAQEDPFAALEWMRTNAEKHPDLVTDQAKRGILTGAALQDPKLAFRLLDELKFEDPAQAAAVITQAARTPEARTAAIAALREHLATLNDKETAADLERSALSSLGQSLRNETFEEASAWIAEAKLEPHEAEAFASGISYHTVRSESGHWIGWMAETLPPDKLDHQVRNLVSNWTREDFHAAGTWLAQAPDDAAKAPAVSSYAETVAQYEPETAEQWALTLPAGSKTRHDTLRRIHSRWPSEDSEGQQAFAKKHGLE